MDEITRVYFLDVAQGTSHVIVFADDSVCIIDCGESSVALVQLLRDLSCTRIRSVVLSHWHDDHVGGTPGLLENFADAIEQFYLPQDQPAAGVLSQPVFEEVYASSEKETKFGVDRLEYRSVDHGLIHEVANGERSSARVTVIYPSFRGSLEAQDQGDENQGSGILMVECGTGRILFPGDAGKKAFKSLVSRLGSGAPIKCNVLAAPHHSGRLSGYTDVSGFRNCYHWLYTDIVNPNHVIISAGTSNTYNHPIEAHLFEAIRAGAKVVCTQMTPQCHTNVHSIGPALLMPQDNAAACSFRDGTGCAGTVVADLDGTAVTLLRLQEHQLLVDDLARTEAPLCRRDEIHSDIA